MLPDNTGAIPADQMAVLQQLGDYIRGCHSPAAALASGSGIANASLRVDFPLAVVDRVILMEDLASTGEVVQGFTVEVLPAGGYNPQPVWASTLD